MFATIVISIALLIAFRLWNMEVEGEEAEQDSNMTQDSYGNLIHIWQYFIDRYGMPFGHICISFFYSLYTKLTFFNMTMFTLKYVPTGLYMYKFLKNMYTTSRERIKQKQIQLEDLQLQIQIVNNKLCVRDAEFKERSEQLRRGDEGLRRIRSRVRNIIAADEVLRRVLDGSALGDIEQEINVRNTSEQDREFLVGFLKGLKYENVANSISERPTKMECGEHADTEFHSPETSVYSSLSDMDVKDCRVKIVKVTNVYKVAYLKHFIKQKRLRRAQKHALLKKRMDSIKKLLEDWQKSLNTVISNNLTILNMDSCIDVASQEAMGDYSKPVHMRDSDSDSDLKNTTNDVYFDEYSLSWTPNPCRTYCYYEDTENSFNREYGELQDYSDVKCPLNVVHQPDYQDSRGHKLSILPEETISEVAIEEIQSEGDEFSIQDQSVAVA